MSDIRPVFLLSLPRAGSTFIQRVLAAHPAISTTSEPWVLLPLLYTMRQGGVSAEYGHRWLVQAVEDFAGELPDGFGDYLGEIRRFVLRLYEKAADDEATYFLDKTPRYALVVEELFRVFPEGKFVFLWRNPLSVAASLMETWARGRWNLDRYRVDLYQGVANLVAAYEARSQQVVGVRYEDLVVVGESEWSRLFGYLDLEFDVALLDRFQDVQLRGRMGDPATARRHLTISAAPIDKWRDTLDNPVRKLWCRRYLRWIGASRLSTMGYDLDTLLHEVDDIPTAGSLVASDIFRVARGAALRGWRAVGENRDC